MHFPWLRRIVGRLRRPLGARVPPFTDSRDYWEERYARGGHSGRGSYGELAAFKADFLNGFVQEHGIRSVIEFGCGDGNQLSLAQYPGYIGLDVAKRAVIMCRERFARDATKSFFLYDPDAFVDRQGVFRAELGLSLDVIYHLVEDPVFEGYMRQLFGAAERFVIAYSSDAEVSDPEPHIRHRPFTRWVGRHLPEWRLVRRVSNPHQVSSDHRSGSFADFFVFQRA
jgi:hypothetical protein